MDVTCRPMTDDDLDAVCELHVRAWQAAYRGIVPQAFLDGMTPAGRAKMVACMSGGDGGAACMGLGPCMSHL